MLRIESHVRCRSNPAIGADHTMSADDAVGLDDRARSDTDLSRHNAIWADLNAILQLDITVYYGRRVNLHRCGRSSLVHRFAPDVCSHLSGPEGVSRAPPDRGGYLSAPLPSFPGTF